MSVTYGFFNSVNGDRTYDADQMSEYFNGLIGNGVFESVDSALQVVAATGMNVAVQTGRAIIECKWIKNSSAATLTINNAHTTLNRYTAVVVRLNLSERTMALATKDGTPATTPTRVAMTNTATVKELCLAQIYVPAKATSVGQMQIFDTRGSELCPWVTGLIEQVDTSELFAQWEAAYADFYARFQAWFETLTSELKVNAYITEFKKVVTGGNSQEITLDMEGYTYEESDIISVYVNGLRCTSSQYTQVENVITVQCDMSLNNTVEIVVYKSKLGDPPGSVSTLGFTIPYDNFTESVDSGSDNASPTFTPQE